MIIGYIYMIVSTVVLAVFYTRIYPGKALSHTLRFNIYNYILNNPGAHYAGIKNGLHLKNGTVRHHLQMLELLGFIRSKQIGMYHRYYCAKDWHLMDRIMYNSLQSSILKTLKDVPGICVSEIARKLNVAISVVLYNVRNMSRNGYIVLQRGKGSRVLCYPGFTS